MRQQWKGEGQERVDTGDYHGRMMPIIKEAKHKLMKLFKAETSIANPANSLIVIAQDEKDVDVVGQKKE
jgi:hypothetical protein